jgi:hypothetical protein
MKPTEAGVRLSLFCLPPVRSVFLLGLLFDFKNTGGMFVRNVGICPNYTYVIFISIFVTWILNFEIGGCKIKNIYTDCFFKQNLDIPHKFAIFIFVLENEKAELCSVDSLEVISRSTIRWVKCGENIKCISSVGNFVQKMEC